MILELTINALCIDVDDFGGAFYEQGVLKTKPSPVVEKETMGVLEHLDDLGIKATFFIPGYTAKVTPTLVNSIVDQGHEIASHGNEHRMIESLGEKGFINDLNVSKSRLEDIAGVPVTIYKAPAWSISPACLWAYNALLEAGFRIDHSAFPSLKKTFGLKPDHFLPFQVADLLTVIPPTSIAVLGKTIPMPGGFYAGHLSPRIQAKIFERFNQCGAPFNYYFHPFEHSPSIESKTNRLKNLYTCFYGLHFGRFRNHLAFLAKIYKFSTLSDAYREYIKI